MKDHNVNKVSKIFKNRSGLEVYDEKVQHLMQYNLRIWIESPKAFIYMCAVMSVYTKRLSVCPLNLKTTSPNDHDF